MNIFCISNRSHLHNYFDALWFAGRRSYDDLTAEEKAGLTGFIMRETKSKSDRAEYIHESDTYDTAVTDLSELLIALSGHDQDALEMYKTMKETLLNNLMAGAIEYSRKRIERMFETQQQMEVDYEYENRKFKAA